MNALEYPKVTLDSDVFVGCLVISVLKCTKLEHLGQKVLQEKLFF